MMKLHLACGEKVIDGFINIDKYQKGKDIINMDLEDYPWNFDNDSVDEIVVNQYVEHVKDKYRFLIECNRILKSGGIMRIKIPIHSNLVEHTSWYHSIRYFDILFTPKNREYDIGGFEKINFKKKRFVWIRPHCIKIILKRLISWINSILFMDYEWEMKKK